MDNNKSATKKTESVQTNVRTLNTKANVKDTFGKTIKVKTPAEKPKFVCVCGKTYSAKQKVDDHIKAVHGGDRYVCSICAKSDYDKDFWFSSKSSFIRHCNRRNHEIPQKTKLIYAAALLAPDE